MNAKYIDITLLLDRSGSMASCWDATIEGVNAFIRGHKENRVEGEKCKFTLVQFDDQYEYHRKATDVHDTPYLTRETYVPRGWTALYDAVARIVRETGERLVRLRQDRRPGKVILVIQTDGWENASKEFVGEAGRKRIKEMIEHQRSKYSWEVVFLGANFDAESVAAGLGILRSHAMRYGASAQGTMDAFSAVTTNTVNFKVGTVATAAYTANDVKAQKDAGLDSAEDSASAGTN